LITESNSLLSMRPLRQADFPSLIGPSPIQNEWLADVAINVLCDGCAEGRRSASLEELASTITAECTTTADLLGACKIVAAGRSEDKIAMDVDQPLTAANLSIYEPARLVPCFAPPKRFFRTFWISTARRLLQSASATMDITVSNH
jgi:hypothetical protein